MDCFYCNDRTHCIDRDDRIGGSDRHYYRLQLQQRSSALFNRNDRIDHRSHRLQAHILDTYLSLNYPDVPNKNTQL
jgi:hypothetical protein